MAAGLRGSTQHILESCIAGTQNVAEAARRSGVGRVIYMSSMSIYDFTKLKDGDVITEQSPLDDQPERRGAYSWGKRKAEDVALSGLQDEATPWTVLRPSVIVGHTEDRFGPVGFKAGGLVVSMSSPKKNLRLVHIEDVGAAIVRLVQNDATKGKVFVVSSPDKVRVSDYLDACLEQTDPQRRPRVLYVPYWFAKLCAAGLIALRKVTGKGPNLNSARLAYIYRDAVVDASRLKEAVGWAPPAGLLDRLRVESTRP
jgi:nucleoside-diphosphate-sugar epimerase